MGRTWIIGAAFALLLVGLGPLAAAERDGHDGWTIARGVDADLLGGGSYVEVRSDLGDARVGVLYGTADRPQAPTVYAVFNRYMGVAEVYDEHGARVGRKVTLPATTVMAHRLETLYEFNDTNGDGLCNVLRINDPLGPADLIAHEPVYKSVSLRTVWEVTTETYEKVGENHSWTFALTARNLPYHVIGDPAQVNASGVLEEVRFTFRLYASTVSLEADVPVYRIRIQTRQMSSTGFGTSGSGSGSGGSGAKVTRVTSSECVRTERMEGKAVRASFKYDHAYTGWDPDPSNANARIVLGSHTFMGTAVRERVREWYDAHFSSMMGADGNVSFRSGDRNEELGSGSVPDEGNWSCADAPRFVQRNRLEFRDNWQRVGRFTWVSNATVTDGGRTYEGEVKYQVEMVRRGVRSVGGRTAAGILVYGGFSYPMGESIVHDPTFSVETFQAVAESMSDLVPVGAAFLQAALAVITVIVVTAVVFLVYMRRRKT